jgi:hypothetical protein
MGMEVERGIGKEMAFEVREEERKKRKETYHHHYLYNASSRAPLTTYKSALIQ